MAAFPARCVEGLDCVLLWFRRDLRLYDNPALMCALQCAKKVIPVFVYAPEEEGQFQLGRTSRWWLKHSLHNLSADIARLGSRLIIRRSTSGEALPTILELLRETNAQGLFFNHLYDAISLTRDHDIKTAVEGAGLMCRSFNSELLYEPWEVLDEDGEPFVTFMDFWNRVISMSYPPSYPLPPPNWLPAVADDLAGRTVDEVDFFQSAVQEGSVEQLKYRWDVSTAAGHARLERFLEHTLPTFNHDRAKVDRNSTSQMSPWLHVGSVSERYIYYRVVSHHAELLRGGRDCTASCLQFLQQCGYREYSRYLSFHFPFVTERSLLAHLRACPSRLDQARFKAWKKGETGYPLVDAAMRQLWSNGWIHNRLRVVVASFLVKNLLLPWQWGLKHLWDAQIDGDLEIDALGWQYVAGCLVDGHPFSYMLDLDIESKRFDPDGQFVRQWLPVLALLPNKYVHHPWRAPADLLEEAGVELGFNYPHPIVSLEDSQRDVLWANSVIERCCSVSASGGSANNNFNSQRPEGKTGTSGESGCDHDAANNAGEAGATGRGGSDSGPQPMQVVLRQPRKQPYKPPSDPAIQAAFLAVPGGEGGGGGSGGLAAGRGVFDVLYADKPDLAGLRLPEHLYRRNPKFEDVTEHRMTSRRGNRRYGARPGSASVRKGVPRAILAPATSQYSGVMPKAKASVPKLCSRQTAITPARRNTRHAAHDAGDEQEEQIDMDQGNDSDSVSCCASNFVAAGPSIVAGGLCAHPGEDESAADSSGPREPCDEARDAGTLKDAAAGADSRAMSHMPEVSQQHHAATEALKALAVKTVQPEAQPQGTADIRLERSYDQAGSSEDCCGSNTAAGYGGDNDLAHMPSDPHLGPLAVLSF